MLTYEKLKDELFNYYNELPSGGSRSINLDISENNLINLLDSFFGKEDVTIFNKNDTSYKNIKQFIINPFLINIKLTEEESYKLLPNE